MHSRKVFIKRWFYENFNDNVDDGDGGDTDDSSADIVLACSWSVG